MSNQILDEELTQKEKYPKTKNWKNWLVLGILWIGIVAYIVSGIFGSIKSLISVVVLLGATFLTYQDFEKGVKLTLGIVILGFFNLLTFIPYEVSFSFSIGPLSIVFDILLMLLGGLHYAFNEPILSPLIDNLRKRRKAKQQENLKTKSLKHQKKEQQQNKSKINRFKHQFRNRSLEELDKIVNNERLLPEAIEAAKELIQEKKD